MQWCVLPADSQVVTRRAESACESAFCLLIWSVPQLAEVHLASCAHEGPEPTGAIRFVGVTPGAPPSSRSCDATATMLPSDLLLLLPAAATHQPIKLRNAGASSKPCHDVIRRNPSVGRDSARRGCKSSWQ